MISYVELDPIVNLTKTTTTWETFDVSASVPSGTSFVVVRIINLTSIARRFGYRAVGDTAPQSASVSGGLGGQSNKYIAVPLSASRTFEMDVSDTQVTIEILGYFNENVEKVNYVPITISQANTWETVSMSSYGIPKAAILLTHNANGVTVKKNGTSTIFFNNAATQAKRTMIVPLSDDYKFDVYSTSNSANLINIVGVINKGFTSYEPIDKTPANITTWTALSAPNISASAILYVVYDPTVPNRTELYGFRKFGETIDPLRRPNGLDFVLQTANAGVVEANVQNINYKVYELGYFSDVTPNIASIDGDNVIYVGQQEVTVSGVELIDGNSALLTTNTRNIALTNYVQSDVSPKFDIPELSSILTSNIRFSTAKIDILDNNQTSIANTTITLLPPDGYGYHSVSDISKSNIEGCIYRNLNPAIANGDQILFDSGADVTINYQGFPELTGTVTRFNYYVWDLSDETWGLPATYYSVLSAANQTIRIVNSSDGKKYSKYATGNNINYPYTVYQGGSVSINGLFDGANIPNQNAIWRVITAREASRWEWFSGGGYTFNPTGANTGSYVAIYEVKDWDGQGNNATASVTVTVS